MLSFKGTKVLPTSVIKDYNFVAVTSNHPTTFAELNPLDPLDRESLKRIEKIFGTRGADASLISDIFQYEGQSTSNITSRVFALTEQEDDFDRIKPSAVLGLAKTTDMDRDNVFIDMIQVNPFYIFDNPYSHLKRCGSAIVESLKNTFINKDLWAHVPKPLIDYFKRKGFEIVNMTSNQADALMKFSGKIKLGV